jgi:transposase
MMLDKYLEDNAGLFLDLVSFMIIDEENVGMHYPDFAFCHPLFSENMRIYSDVKVSRMLNSVSKDSIVGFLNDWNAKRDHKQKIYISYDSSNKNSQAGDIDLVEFGKPKDNKGKPIFNVSLVFDKSNQIPLLYEEYPGSVNDVSQFSYMVDKVKEYDYKNIGFILDRGYFSEDNIQYMEENGYAFIIMVKGRKKLVASLVEENRNTFETVRSCAIRSYRVYGKTVRAKLFESDKKDRFIHIFFNPSKQAAEREQLEQKIEKYRVFLEKHINTDTKFGKGYHDYFTLKYDKKGILYSVQERADVIEQELRLCGYFCIVTSEEMKASQALIQYKGRDISEKLFSSDKTFLGSHSMRIHSSKAMSTKIFVEFIALIVRNRIYNLLKQTMMRMEGKQNYLTVPKALRELEKIEMIRRNNGRYRLDHAVTKKQKIILSSFGLSEDDVINSAAEISSLLAKNQSLLTVNEEDDEGEEDDFDGEDEDDFCY